MSNFIHNETILIGNRDALRIRSKIKGFIHGKYLVYKNTSSKITLRYKEHSLKIRITLG